MSLIKSISGIRGTIGGGLSDGLNPVNIAQFVNAYATIVKRYSGKERPTIVVGRDGRLSGEMVALGVTSSLMGAGCDVIFLGLATTPTVEMGVLLHQADGGIIITASHNPMEWNALKLLDNRGEFFSSERGGELMELVEAECYQFATVESLGSLHEDPDMLERHIDAILALEEVDLEAIRQRGYRVAFDAVNSVGAIAVARLLDRLGVAYHGINMEVTGRFAHNPEPLPEHITEICQLIASGGYDAGFVVDPDVDRLSIIDEKGLPIGEEYTLVSIADYLLSQAAAPQATVSNLSSTRALRDITERRGGVYTAAAVGEVNVVEEMRRVDALIGGEGNGGVIFPKLHAGRDALLGIALFLTMMAKRGESVSKIRSELPTYHMSKQKIEGVSRAPKELFALLSKGLEESSFSLIDGLKIDYPDSWVHMRASNTEPIIRIYAEAPSQVEADLLASEYKQKLLELMK